MANDNEIEITPRIQEGIQWLLQGAIRVSADGLVRLNEGYRQQIKNAIDAEQAALTVQIDLPGGTVRVLIDGENWAGPQCLFAIENMAASPGDGNDKAGT